MPPPAGQQQSGQDNSMWMMWLVILIFAVLFGVWYAYKVQVIRFFIQIKLYEVSALGLVFPKLNESKLLLRSMMYDPSNVSYKNFVQAMNSVGYTIRWFFSGLILLLGYILMRATVVPKYRQTYNMQTFKECEEVNWPHITPVVDLRLVKDDINKGKWSMAMRPMDFAKHYKLIREKEIPPPPGKIVKDKVIIAELIEGRAGQIFALQLGNPWKGIGALNMHTRALFAAFATRADGDRKTCDNLLLKLSGASKNGVKDMDFSSINALCQKHGDSKPVRKALMSHGYVYTVMAAMLELARYDGVLASADFLWIKPIDRKLWFTLNCVGRRTPNVEVAGIYSHFRAEVELGRPLVVPYVDQATLALKQALIEVIYQRDEDE
jgi:intracellular multiplication protein IcmP